MIFYIFKGRDISAISQEIKFTAAFPFQCLTIAEVEMIREKVGESYVERDKLSSVGPSRKRPSVSLAT